MTSLTPERTNFLAKSMRQLKVLLLCRVSVSDQSFARWLNTLVGSWVTHGGGQGKTILEMGYETGEGNTPGGEEMTSNGQDQADVSKSRGRQPARQADVFYSIARGERRRRADEKAVVYTWGGKWDSVDTGRYVAHR